MAARMRQICLVAHRLDTLAADFKAVLVSTFASATPASASTGWRTC